MRKFVAALVFLTIFCVGVSAYTFTVEAWDRDLNVPIESIGPDFTGAKIYVNLVEVPGATTPWSFVNAAFNPGSYSVSHEDYQNDQWQPVAVQVNVVYGVYVFRFYGVRRNVPVQLSSFTTTYFTAQNYVKIAWTSQSESNMNGYYVYRSESNSLAEAVNITPTMYEATNTSTTHTYSHVDNEVEPGHTYYYWLESVESVGSQFFGPISETLETTVAPPFNGISRIAKNAYPNPFKTNTTFTVDLKANETGTISVFNVLGQVVRTFSVNQQGQTSINWDGKDSKGIACSNGIYFYRFSTPTTSQTQKLIIVN